VTLLNRTRAFARWAGGNSTLSSAVATTSMSRTTMSEATDTSAAQTSSPQVSPSPRSACSFPVGAFHSYSRELPLLCPDFDSVGTFTGTYRAVDANSSQLARQAEAVEEFLVLEDGGAADDGAGDGEDLEAVQDVAAAPRAVVRGQRRPAVGARRQRAPVRPAQGEDTSSASCTEPSIR
jgi:hypothetical protein